MAALFMETIEILYKDFISILLTQILFLSMLVIGWRFFLFSAVKLLQVFYPIIEMVVMEP